MTCTPMVWSCGALVFTFKQARWLLRGDDPLRWKEWVNLGHGLQLAPVSVEQAVEHVCKVPRNGDIIVEARNPNTM